MIQNEWNPIRNFSFLPTIIHCFEPISKVIFRIAALSFSLILPHFLGSIFHWLYFPRRVPHHQPCRILQHPKTVKSSSVRVKFTKFFLSSTRRPFSTYRSWHHVLASLRLLCVVESFQRSLKLNVLLNISAFRIDVFLERSGVSVRLQALLSPLLLWNHERAAQISFSVIWLVYNAGFWRVSWEILFYTFESQYGI